MVLKPNLLKNTKDKVENVNLKNLIMEAKFSKEIEKLKSESERLNLGLSDELIIQTAQNLGPSLYLRDAKFVDSNSPSEIGYIKTEFLMGELGLEDGPILEEAIKEVLLRLDILKNKKYRVLVYALLRLYFEAMKPKYKEERNAVLGFLVKIKNYILGWFK